MKEKSTGSSQLIQKAFDNIQHTFMIKKKKKKTHKMEIEEN